MDYMERALSLARLALGHTSPNPAVGAVIVNNGALVGEGYTQPPGGPHAEVVALERAGEAARGAGMYVTLEPCVHFGRTPPCTQTIVGAGIAEVHLATLDPNPLVSGRGREELEKASVRTYVGEHAEEARQLNEAYIKFISTSFPFVIAKFAMSLDGKIATRGGRSKWISGEESRQYAHRLRQSVDAIMVGANTVMTDDPLLTARGGGVARGGEVVRGEQKREPKQPLRIVVDSRGRTPLAARVFQSPGRVLLATAESLNPARMEQLSKAGDEVLSLPPRKGMVNLRELMRELGRREITSVLVEGGGRLLGSLFDQGLVDKVYAFVAPMIIGGEKAIPAVGGTGVREVEKALRLKRVKVERFGEDVLISGYL